MNNIKTFEMMMGGRWTGVKLHQKEGPFENPAPHPMKICDAIKQSSTGPMTLTKDLVNCPGALRSLGWMADGKEQLSARMVRKNNIQKNIAESIVAGTPHIDNGISAVTIGTYENPDLIISYAQPKAAMQLILKWQQLNGGVVDVSISSLMAICGGVLAGAYLSEKICLSFGCPESRDYGSIGNDRLIIGLPVGMINQFID